MLFHFALILLCLSHEAFTKPLEDPSVDPAKLDSPNDSGPFDFVCLFIQCTPTTIKTPTSTAALMPPTDCKPSSCGVVYKARRIVGGVETEERRYPWMATLNYKKRFFCGASLINDRYVVTAAHCVDGFKERQYENLAIRLLEHNITSPTVHVIERKVLRIKVHEDYSTRTLDSDVALIRLNETVPLGDITNPVCLPDSVKSFANETGIVTGWGAICEGCDVAQTLQEVNVRMLSAEECSGSSYGPTRITKNMLCAGEPEGGKDSCQGDSGGPMHYAVPDTEQHQLAGIVSWGWGCARPKYPGVYTRVGNFNEWIEKNTIDACKYEKPVVGQQQEESQD